jgi:transcriptional regulator with XRE-family HTH domain
MKVDAQRIRHERERRAWTQAQLAGAAGLGLRTVQRIEREGSASFESAQAIAAALELSIGDLRIEAVVQPEPKQNPQANLEPNPRKPTFPLLRLFFAGLSGVAVGYWLDARNGGVVLSRGPFWASAFDYLVAGFLFAAAVLIPELPRSQSFVRRSLGLVVASAFSFFAAVMIALEGPELFGALSSSSASAFGPRWEPAIYTLLLASIVGVAIILAAARALIGVYSPLRLWTAGMIAAVLGGVVLGRPYTYFFPIPFASFAIWHMLLCVAILVGRGREIPFPSVRPLIRAIRAVLPGGRLWRLPQETAARIPD